MRTTGLSLCLWLALAATAPGQVTVEITLPQQQFLPGEAIPAAVRITNRSGQTLHLGAEDNWLTFNIESRENLVVEKLGDAPVKGPFELNSTEVATKRVELAPHFALSQPGRYSIVATVHIKDWDREVVSPPKSFDLVLGARLWEQEFGIPTSNAEPEVRKYILQQVNYLKGQLRLYLRVTDGTGARIFKVVPVGMILSFSRPQPQIDSLSNLHLLYQNGPNSCSYSVFTPDGEQVIRQTYDILDTSRPRLQTDAAGKVGVAGGGRRVTASDIPPPPKDSALLDDAPPLSLLTNNAPAVTNTPAKPVKK